jgi:hypothetical protein
MVKKPYPYPRDFLEGNVLRVRRSMEATPKLDRYYLHYY